MVDMSEELGPTIRAARERARLSTQAAAAPAGISPAYLNKLESGKVNTPSPRVLHRLSEALDIPYWTLMELAGYVPVDRPAGAPKHPAKRDAATNERLLELLLEIKASVDALTPA
jgi:transcriptional regulator with XRE-family HTH domain